MLNFNICLTDGLEDPWMIRKASRDDLPSFVQGWTVGKGYGAEVYRELGIGTYSDTMVFSGSNKKS